MPTNVSLNKNYLLLTGTAQTEQLSSQVIPSNASQNIVWTSSDTNVATVNENGVVTPVANGIAIITATTTDGSNLNATCPVMVNIKKESTDVNGDGNVNTADVVAIYNFIINGE
ncbi:MAG: Ig-like domain-containing protein [Bacteroidaceae bacterium]|nr:Ig-like domain-containing protein [Bacteroidaceae bacterium]